MRGYEMMQSSKRQLQKEQTRKKIMDTAFKIYSEKGFTSSTSIIAKEAGIAHGSIFLHFPTLNDLLTCIIKEFANTLSLRLHHLSETNDNIEQLLDAHIDTLSEYEIFYTRLITEMVLLPEEARTAFAAIQTGLAFNFNKIMNHEIESGVLKRLPPHILFNTWIGLIHYYLQNKDLFAPDGSVLKRYKKQLIFTYCELLRKQ